MPILRLVFAALAFLALTPAAVNAAEVTLNYQAVMHVAKSESLPVLDNKKHLMGVGAFRGIAILPDGQLAQHQYDGWFDLAEGSGPFHGYARWLFSDGSTLSARYSGAVKANTKDDAEVSATFSEFSGTGRFQDATGQGSFAGRRFEAINKGGTTYLKGALTLQTGN
jgi:hypothetical protein